MTGWLIVNEFLNSAKFYELHTWFLESAMKLGIQLEMKSNGELLADLPRTKVEDGSNKEVDFVLFWDKDIKLAYHLEQLGYPVFNPSQAIELCDDKARTHLALMHAGIPMPRTIIAPMTYNNVGYTNYDFLNQVEERIGFPMVIKEAFGSFGQQVYLVHNREELLEKVQSLGVTPCLFQEFIQSSFGRDIRLQVVGEEVVAGMYRYSETGDFRANLTLGGKMKPYQPTKEQRDLAIQCCKELGLAFAGVDLLFGEEEEAIVCEVNSNAHFKTIYDCTGVNVADSILAYIKQKVQ